MYLARIRINTDCREVIEKFEDSNYWHKNIMSGFMHTGYEGKDKRSKHQILFRIVNDVIYVQSNVEPVYENKNWILNVDVKCIDHVLQFFKTGGEYGFDVVCAPSKAEYINGKSNIIWLKSDADKRAWFESKGKYCGYEVIDTYTDKYENIVLKNIGGNGYEVRASKMHVTFRITDVDKFRNFYCSGIGREKAYGAGMLMLSF